MEPVQVYNKINDLMRDGLLDHLLLEITQSIALEIVETLPEEAGKREELYMLNKAIKRLNDKLQECLNNYDGDI